MRSRSAWKILRWSIVLSGLLSAPVLSSAPKLIVILVGDQVRADYVERFHPALAPDGLLRFREAGVYFVNAAFDHASTRTSPGHLLIGSGLYPFQSGILNNEWYDRTSHRVVSAAEIIPGGKRVTLRWFAGPSLAQRLHRIHPHSRVISVSYKDRGALFLAGPGQDEAYWWDPARTGFRTYHASAPSWLDTFNQRVSSFPAQNPAWDMLVIPDSHEALGFADNAAWTAGHVANKFGLGLIFPHPTRTLDATLNSPYGDQLTEELAEQAVLKWQLGKNPTGEPDILTVSFSEVDLIGHIFGPDSPEIRDAFLRLDLTVARLMKAIEKSAGSNVLWVFTADHGMTPFPEVSQHRGFKAGRVSLDRKSLPDGDLIEAISEPYVYIDTHAVSQNHLTRDRAVVRLQAELKALDGVDAVYSMADIQAGRARRDVIRAVYIARHGEPSRAGDLYVVLKPKFIFSHDAFGTTHGQPTEDDQAVPMGFYSPTIRPGVYREPISPARIAPTLLKILGVPALDLQPPLELQRKFNESANDVAYQASTQNNP